MAAKDPRMLARERRQHYRYMHRIYRMLNSAEWRVCYLKLLSNPKVCWKLGVTSKVVGTVDTSEGIIYVDYRYDVLATVVHECLHVLIENQFEPRQEKEEEKEVQRLEAFIMERMSRVQATRLHRLISYCLVKEKPRPLL